MQVTENRQAASVPQAEVLTFRLSIMSVNSWTSEIAKG